MTAYLERRKWVPIILTLLIGIEIFYMSSIPGSSTPSTGETELIPLIYHFSIFFLFNFFLIISLSQNKKIRLANVFIAVIISIIYSVVDEIHQFFVPLRTPDMADLLIDITGIFFSTIAYLCSKK